MPLQFTKDDDPTNIVQFSFIDQHGQVTKSSIKAALKPPYPAKYYLNAVLTVIGLTVFLLWNFGIIKGTKLGFFCNDPIFTHKYRGDTVTPVILGVGLSLLFFGVYFLVEIIRQSNFKDVFRIRSLVELYVYCKQYLLGIIIAGGVSEIAKTIVGEHRPHFFDTCMPDTNLNCTNGTYIFDFTCTNSYSTFLDYVDASRSFPSGHASIAWFGTLFCCYIIHSRLPIHKTGLVLKVLMLGICLSFGLMSSLTRITDRRHHWWDVLVGTFIGAVAAIYIIRMTQRQVKLLRQKILMEQKEEVSEIERIQIED